MAMTLVHCAPNAAATTGEAASNPRCKDSGFPLDARSLGNHPLCRGIPEKEKVDILAKE